MDWIVGALCALLVSGAAYLKQSLSLSGTVAAVVMGTVYYGAGNLFWFGLLLLFFISSSVLSHYRGDRKEELERSYAKSGRRDASQVLANGGLGMLACLGNWIWPDPGWGWFFAGTMAAVTADTWATELGGLSRTAPRSIVTGRRIPPGTSGGVTLLGSAAALAGAVFIGGAAWLLLAWTGNAASGESISAFELVRWVLIGGLSGLLGAFADSWLGATVQWMHRCTVCGKEVEVASHCGHETVPVRGFRWMNNDAVNLLSSLAAGGLALGIGMLV
ncbi:DUF92 domain-containing protein [Paenibacillus macerans]|uniref:DUF92 domain-containing protein n=1 Tax=Paenibacillus macerans TaxID=44252 RepID=UPI002040427D|nr:DUF92 domain-containing protein [Paenibacillus macerans]MCM3703916.1 DUF92 domain-containing protein [Paenibacillus macerans]